MKKRTEMRVSIKGTGTTNPPQPPATNTLSSRVVYLPHVKCGGIRADAIPLDPKVRAAFEAIANLLKSRAALNELRGASEYLLDVIREQAEQADATS